jgi:CRISPR/Cas system-associated protein Cas5 (RAMP superfamily)
MAFSDVVSEENAVALRVSITRQDGAEVDQVLHLDTNELARITRLESKIMRLIGKEQRLGVIAATRAVWAQLQSSAETPD